MRCVVDSVAGLGNAVLRVQFLAARSILSDSAHVQIEVSDALHSFEPVGYVGAERIFPQLANTLYVGVTGVELAVIPGKMFRIPGRQRPRQMDVDAPAHAARIRMRGKGG